MTASPLFAVGSQLPPHQPNCFGCGPANAAGLHLRCTVTPEGVAGRFRLEEHHEGGPGVAHGGIVAAVLDDLLGYLLYRIGEPMVTARLEIDFRRPLPLFVDVDAVARIVSEEGRKVWTEGELRAPDGTVYAQAKGLFVRVRPDHFLRASEAAVRRLAAWRDAGAQGEAGPGPVGP
jgi:acyl-coenzyme A thioesterase PaaI-like protein